MKQPTIEEQIAVTRKLRLDWRTVTNRSAVWVLWRGQWRPAQVYTTRSRTYCNAEIQGYGLHPVAYSQLRARRPGLNGADIPLEPAVQKEPA